MWRVGLGSGLALERWGSLDKEQLFWMQMDMSIFIFSNMSVRLVETKKP